LNAIISGNSDEAVLKNQETDGGLLNYFLCVRRAFVLALCISLPYSRSFGFSTECLGQHSGDAQAANLGDGDGYSKLFSSLQTTADHGKPYYLLLCFQRTRLLS